MFAKGGIVASMLISPLTVGEEFTAIAHVVSMQRSSNHAL
jgi:hypothetical protein